MPVVMFYLGSGAESAVKCLPRRKAERGVDDPSGLSTRHQAAEPNGFKSGEEAA